MMRSLFYILLVVCFISCKKEDNAAPTVVGKFDIDVKNHDLRLNLTKISYTDSIIMQFTGVDSAYNCNLYRINFSQMKEADNYSFVFGNIFYSPGFCVWGNFPAYATHQAKELKPGNYTFNVKKNNQTVTGTLKVTATAYTFDWQHDAVMKIEPKVVNR